MTTVQKKVYIAGKITGDDQYKGKFQQVQQELEVKGYKVISPAVLPGGLTKADYMRICFSMIDCADYVYFLGDWKESLGARLEMNYCTYIGKPRISLWRKWNNEHCE